MRTCALSLGKRVATLTLLLPVAVYLWVGADTLAATKPHHVGTHGAQTPPTVAAAPKPLVVVLGAPAVFAVIAEGAPPLFYRWHLKGTNLTGATNDALVLPHVQHADWGDYSVVVSNPYGSVTSRTPCLKCAVS